MLGWFAPLAVETPWNNVTHGIWRRDGVRGISPGMHQRVCAREAAARKAVGVAGDVKKQDAVASSPPPPLPPSALSSVPSTRRPWGARDRASAGSNVRFNGQMPKGDAISVEYPTMAEAASAACAGISSRN